MGRERESGKLDYVKRWKGYQQRRVEERAQCVWYDSSNALLKSSLHPNYIMFTNLHKVAVLW